MDAPTVRIEIPEQQIVELVDQLSPAAKQQILKRLIIDYERWELLTDTAEARMRELSRQRGLDWDSLNEEERLALVDTLLHED